MDRYRTDSRCAYRQFNELRDSPTAGGWLRTVARNLSLNHLERYRRRWSFFSEIISADESESEIEIPAENSDGLFDAGERHDLVEHALQSLPQTHRVPLVLYHFDGLHYEEIAEKLGVSLAKVKTDIFRAREALRRKLQLTIGEDLK